MNRWSTILREARGWRSNAFDRIDRASIVVAVAYAAFCVALGYLEDPKFVQLGARAGFYVVVVGTTLVAMAIAMVAVARGASRWAAYPLAAIAVALVGLAAGYALEPIHWISEHRSGWPRVLAYLSLLSGQLVAPAILFVQHGSAAQRVRALRRLEAERATQVDRLAQERLHAERSTIDHDLVVAAMRFALAAPEREAGRAEQVLDALAQYLRAAQQRDASDRQAVVTALHGLQQMCAGFERAAAAERAPA
jgi:hypothetical protein